MFEEEISEDNLSRHAKEGNASSPDQAEVSKYRDGGFGPQSNMEMNKLSPKDRAVHDWYRFVLSFPPHLVRHYLVVHHTDHKG
jgi:hypothetical protein